jgi:cytochrome b561
VNLHVLFGALLWICVVARFYRRVRQAPSMLPNELRALVRTLSRFVYLVLYVLMFFRIAIGIMRGAPHQPIFAPAEDFQGYLAGGLIALATIHALAALYRYFGSQGTRASSRYGSAKRPANVA